MMETKRVGGIRFFRFGPFHVTLCRSRRTRRTQTILQSLASYWRDAATV